MFADRPDVALQDRQVLLNQPMKEEHIEVEGRVMTVLPGTMFRVELENKHLVLATICGKMRASHRRRPGENGDVALRPGESTHHLAVEVETRRFRRWFPDVYPFGGFACLAQRGGARGRDVI